MLFKKSLSLVLFLSISTFAQESFEDIMKKALEGITEVEVLKEGESKIISEKVIILENSTKKVKKAISKKTVSKTKRVIAKKTTARKSTFKKRKHVKRKHRKRRAPKRKKFHENFDDLPMVKTYGVVNVSQPYER